jgi:hypothetical protein
MYVSTLQLAASVGDDHDVQSFSQVAIAKLS